MIGISSLLANKFNMNSFLTLAQSSSSSMNKRRLVATALHRYRRRRVSSTASAPSPEKSGTATKATDDSISVDGTASKRTTLNAQCLQPRSIFPWRSSPDHLPRLVKPAKPNVKSNPNDTEEEAIEKNALIEEYYESDYFTKGGPLGHGWPSPMEPWFRGSLYCMSMHLLGVSWPSILMPWTRKDWEHDMEWAFCHAFSNGVCGMIDDVYEYPENDTKLDSEKDVTEEKNEGDSFDVDLDISFEPLPLEEKSGDASTERSNGEHTHDKKSSEDSMLEQNLIQLYQSAKKHSHPSKVNIVLRTVPHSARIESMFPVFGLSRTLVEAHPNLRHTYRNLLKQLQTKHKDAVLAGKNRLGPIEVGTFFYEGMQEVMERSAKLSDDGNATVTIVAQVSINCKEIFCVRDVESGEIIQGFEDGQPRDVTHLVRFEMVVRENLVEVDGYDDTISGDWEMEIGRWQITDWDDLLAGTKGIAFWT